MVKLESFELCLDRFDATYAAGDNLSGSVYLSVSSRNPVKIKELSVTLVGEAKTSWVNKISDNIYDSTEPYLNLKEPFRRLLDEIVEENGHLSPGQHRFPFKFSLPPTLPSSYEGEFGYVRYTCVAEVNAVGSDTNRRSSLRAGFSSRNKKMAIEKPITVTAQVGINELSLDDKTDNGLRKEAGYETAGCCGFGVGSVNAAIAIQKRAFVVGQPVLIEVWLENHSRRPLRAQAVVGLVQDVHFRSVSFFQSATDSKTVSRLVEAVEIAVPERGKESTKTVVLKIPANVPATTLIDSLISVQYKLRLEVEDFDIVLPIGIASKL